MIIVDDKSENISDIENALQIYSDKKILLVKNSFKSNAFATRNQGARMAQSNGYVYLIRMMHFQITNYYL
ncbi:hypothetical protein DMH27_09790 [Raoultella planticola]|nr:hypothetical protein [Raoultella planticola]